MRRLVVLILVALMLSALCPASELFDYVQKPDASFKWEMVSRTESPIAPRYDLKMTSQTWQGIVWTHEVHVFVPKKPRFRNAAFLLITGGKPGSESALGGVLAASLGCPVAILYDIPNQPLYGLKEDDLIAHTFVKAVETGDFTWPLLLPMTKSAVRAMDAVQAFSKSELKAEITGFVVCGASKRGWTTWLTAAVDPVRVKAIAPMVYDNLNLGAQMTHQIASWGSYSDMIEPYTSRGVQELMPTLAGKKLTEIVDPWTYVDRLTMPKLIVNGSNNPYWTLDSLNLYWKNLSGPKYVLYVPNAGHGLNDFQRVIATVGAFTEGVMSGDTFPRMTWKHMDGKSAHRLNILVAPKAESAVVWAARSDTKDFRQAKWESIPMKRTLNGFTAVVRRPEKGYSAVFGEVNTTVGDRQCMLSTQVAMFR